MQKKTKPRGQYLRAFAETEDCSPVELGSREDFVEHFRKTYSTPLPIWMAVELWDFGMLSHFLSGMRHQDQATLAAKYG